MREGTKGKQLGHIGQLGLSPKSGAPKAGAVDIWFRGLQDPPKNNSRNVLKVENKKSASSPAELTRSLARCGASSSPVAAASEPPSLRSWEKCWAQSPFWWLIMFLYSGRV